MSGFHPGESRCRCTTRGENQTSQNIQAESPFHPLHSNTPEQVAVLCSIQLPSSLSPLSPEEVQMERERQKKLAQERRRTEALLSDIDMNRQRNIMKEWWRWCREGGEKF